MNKENRTNKGTYHQKLYAACRYLINHCEEFQEFCIYEELKRDGVSKEWQTDNIIRDLSGKLEAQYLFLIGAGELQSDKSNPKGSNIMPVIDEETLEDKTLAKMLAIIHHFINKSETRIKLNHRVFAINLDKEITMMNYLIESMFSNKVTELAQWMKTRKMSVDIDASKKYFELMSKNYDIKRKFALNEFNIKFLEMLDVEWYYRYLMQLDFYRKRLIDENKSIYDDEYPQFGRLEIYYNTWLYLDLSCRAILQYVIQGIIKNTKNTDKVSSIKKLNDVILELLAKELKPIPDKYFSSKVKLNQAPKKNLLKIYSFYFIRDKFLQDTKILKNISDGYDKQEDTLEHISLESQNYSWDDLQNLFGNGAIYDLKTFKHNLANCFLLIKKINAMSLEGEILCSPVRLRALYRGIYLNKPYRTAKRKTGMTIVNEFVRTNDIAPSDYYFIREILNMELCKEHGLLREFYAKNELQENLYYLVCLYLARLKPIEIIAKFDIALSSIKVKIYELCDEFSEYEGIKKESDKNIDVTLPSDYYEITKADYKKIYQRLEKLFNISNS